MADTGHGDDASRRAFERADQLTVLVDTGEDGVLRVRPTGDLTLATGATLRDALAVLAPTPTAVEIDLCDVTFVDSFAMGVLLTSCRRLARRRIPVTLLRAAPEVHETFVVGGLDHVLPFRARGEAAEMACRDKSPGSS